VGHRRSSPLVLVGTFQGTGGGPPLQARSPPRGAGNLQKPGWCARESLGRGNARSC
jgi:hypothetical protein